MSTHVEFPHPYTAVDVVILAIIDGELRVPLVARSTKGVAGVGLPGVYVQYDERIADARARVLADKCGITGVAEDSYRPLTPRDAPDRDERRRTISLGSWAPVAPSVIAEQPEGCVLGTVTRGRGRPSVHLNGRTSPLILDHLEIVREAVAGLIDETDHLRPDVPAIRSLLPSTFAYRDVEAVLTATAAIDGRAAPDTNALRRRLGKFTVGTGEMESLQPGQRHRPAELRRWAR